MPTLLSILIKVKWEMFREIIEKELYVEPKGPGGRRPFDKIFMFKILILQTIYNI